ncbi:MAG: hypothetical protein KZQ58_10020 [gamma proteobacterium symbiont of Bathyaustriella thionipta]|nr:hypothetical protein [gamma proteobacterium symbiont of Bathyaustriella thionipta]
MRINFTLASVILALLLFGLSACTHSPGKSIAINNQELLVGESMLEEISRLLEELGYQWQALPDADFGHKVKVAQQFEEYRMLFHASDNPHIKISLHVPIGGSHAGLHFYQDDSEILSREAEKRYAQLSKRIEEEFGSRHVDMDAPVITP